MTFVQMTFVQMTFVQMTFVQMTFVQMTFVQKKRFAVSLNLSCWYYEMALFTLGGWIITLDLLITVTMFFFFVTVPPNKLECLLSQALQLRVRPNRPIKVEQLTGDTLLGPVS
jgi:hypothetical protein